MIAVLDTERTVQELVRVGLGSELGLPSSPHPPGLCAARVCIVCVCVCVCEREGIVCSFGKHSTHVGGGLKRLRMRILSHTTVTQTQEAYPVKGLRRKASEQIVSGRAPYSGVTSSRVSDASSMSMMSSTISTMVISHHTPIRPLANRCRFA